MNTTGQVKGPDIAVALHALEADATRWATAAGDLRAAAGVADRQGLDAGEFSFAGREVATAYEALRSRTAALLREGAANFDAVAEALRGSATAYAAEEEARARRLAAADGRGPR